MTSKAAKKAYQKRNKGPKVSRAEQRRLDAEELKKQKKEYERERNASRAKDVRERKAAKEEAEKAARKKMGVPEPSRFVRASQPTISRFVTNGNKRSWQILEDVSGESEGTLYDQEDESLPPAKRPALDNDAEDEFGDFPAISQSDLPDLFDQAHNRAEETQIHKADLRRSPQKQLTPIEEEEYSNEIIDSDLQNLPERKVSIWKDNEYDFENDESLEDMVTTQLLSEAAEAANRPPLITKSANQPTPSNMVKTSWTSLKQPMNEGSTLEIKRPALQECSINMPPPRVPVSAAKSITFAPTPLKPKHNPLKAKLPSSATQAFLEDHLDDFFPSPSQEVRELLEDVDDLPSNTQVATELSTNIAVYEDPLNMFSSQDLVLSSQDLLEISTPSRVLVKVASDVDVSPPRLSPQKVVSKEKRLPGGRFFEEKDEDLLHAALHESTVTAVEKELKVLVKESPAKTSRTFQRFQSTATDYGDDEIDEQELWDIKC